MELYNSNFSPLFLISILDMYWPGGCSSSNHYIYYCGQESLRRNGVDLIVNKRVQNAVIQLLSHSCFSCSFVFKSMWIHGLQHARLRYPSPCPRVCSDSCPFIESVMPSKHLILCCPLLVLPSIFASIRVFSSESALCIRWPECWSFSFSISLSNEYSGLISFEFTGLISFLSKGFSRVFSRTTVQRHQFFSAQPFLLSKYHTRKWQLEKP